ncbi:MAG: NADH-quinone oxidoreductase subunit J [Nitrospirae bacterium]|nr:NADH-quinone oxidoreductase subunit J [Nitrospirota bacterium]
MIQQLPFIYFGGMALVCAILVVVSRIAIYSAMALLGMFVHVAGLFILLDAPFLAGVQLLVYAGAILVLYLFVVMLLNVHGRGPILQRQTPWAIILTLLAAGEMGYLVLKSHFYPKLPAIPHPSVPTLGNTETIGMVLYTQYLFPFEVASVVLLIALVGAIVMARGRGGVSQG